jgi:hypothetical protein
VIELSRAQWTALYNRVLHIALGMTRTDDHKRAFTQRDRAQEAVQQAWLRYLRLRPAGLDTPDAVRDYVLGAVRSSLGHAVARAQTRREIEGKAVAEEAAITRTKPGTTPSAEALKLAQGEQLADETRAANLLRRLKRRLKRAGDTVGLGVLDCVARRIVDPEAQARELGCDVAEIYNARKRRKRAMEQVLSDYAKDVDEPDDDGPEEAP